jgi:hypothetical protein
MLTNYSKLQLLSIHTRSTCSPVLANSSSLVRTLNILPLPSGHINKSTINTVHSALGVVLIWMTNFSIVSKLQSTRLGHTAMYFFQSLMRYHASCTTPRRFNVRMCCAAGLKRRIISQFKATSTILRNTNRQLRSTIKSTCNTR